jgi:hypothetical protein
MNRPTSASSGQVPGSLGWIPRSLVRFRAGRLRLTVLPDLYPVFDIRHSLFPDMNLLPLYLHTRILQSRLFE